MIQVVDQYRHFCIIKLQLVFKCTLIIRVRIGCTSFLTVKHLKRNRPARPEVDVGYTTGIHTYFIETGQVITVHLGEIDASYNTCIENIFKFIIFRVVLDLTKCRK